MSSVSKEVGNKFYKASEIDDKLFHYSYGFSFILLKVYSVKMAIIFKVYLGELS